MASIREATFELSLYQHHTSLPALVSSALIGDVPEYMHLEASCEKPLHEIQRSISGVAT